jgi:ABC transport system ATP-binding/permease protein
LMKEQNENENLSSLLKNTQSLNRIVETDGELIQKSEPIFHDPSKNYFLQAHFFAPRKALFGMYFDTFAVNILVIWSMSIFLLIALYFDLLRKFLEMMSNIMSRVSYLLKRKESVSKKSSAKLAVS